MNLDYSQNMNWLWSRYWIKHIFKQFGHLLKLGVNAYDPADNLNEGAFVDICNTGAVGGGVDCGGFHGAEF